MKYIAILISACLFASAFAVPTSGSLKGGAGSYTGATGSASVLFTTGVADAGGSFTVVNSGGSPYRLSSGASGDTWGYISGVLTTNCPGFGPGTGGQSSVTFRKTSGAVLGSLLLVSASSPATFKFAVNDVAAAGDAYELVVGVGSLGGYSCTATVSNARFTLTMPIVN